MGFTPKFPSMSLKNKCLQSLHFSGRRLAPSKYNPNIPRFPLFTVLWPAGGELGPRIQEILFVEPNKQAKMRQDNYRIYSNISPSHG